MINSKYPNEPFIITSLVHGRWFNCKTTGVSFIHARRRPTTYAQVNSCLLQFSVTVCNVVSFLHYWSTRQRTKGKTKHKQDNNKIQDSVIDFVSVALYGTQCVSFNGFTMKTRLKLTDIHQLSLVYSPLQCVYAHMRQCVNMCFNIDSKLFGDLYYK